MYHIEASQDERLLLPLDSPVNGDSKGATPVDMAHSDQREAQEERVHIKIPTRDTALRRVVNEWLDDRPDLRDAQYVDLLLLKSMLRRHYNRLSAQLTKNGVLNKGDGKPKQALDALLSISGEIRRIDHELPDPPAAPRGTARVIISTVCSECGPPVEGVSIFDDDEPQRPRHPAEVVPAEGGKPVSVIQDPPAAPEQHAQHENLRVQQAAPIQNTFRPIHSIDDQQHDHPPGSCRLC